MAKNWTDQGNGRWKLTVSSDDPDDGTPMQVFYGSKDEIADKLADAQGSATRRITELKRGQSQSGGPGNNPPPQNGPRPLTAAERMQVTADLTNPANVDRAVTRIMESVVGPVENMRENQQAEREDRQAREAESATLQFFDETPDWHPSEHNKTTLVRYMQTQGLSPLKQENFTRAFEALSAAGLLQPKPQGEDNETQSDASQPERIAPSLPAPKTPTRISTGVRSSDVSGNQPRPTNRVKYSREQLANMSAAEYKRLMTSDPELARSVEFWSQSKRRVG